MHSDNTYSHIPGGNVLDHCHQRHHGCLSDGYGNVWISLTAQSSQLLQLVNLCIKLHQHYYKRVAGISLYIVWNRHFLQGSLSQVVQFQRSSPSFQSASSVAGQTALQQSNSQGYLCTDNLVKICTMI